jgi:hypothetical protein
VSQEALLLERVEMTSQSWTGSVEGEVGPGRDGDAGLRVRRAAGGRRARRGPAQDPVAEQRPLVSEKAPSVDGRIDARPSRHEDRSVDDAMSDVRNVSGVRACRTRAAQPRAMQRRGGV